MPRKTKPWPQSWIEEAFKFADDRSKDPNTQVGCVLVNPISKTIVSKGFNGLPRGVEDTDERYAREPRTPAGRRPKDLWVRHAEQNAIDNAARLGTRTLGATAYVTHHPCAQCAGALVNAGIACVVIAEGTTTAMPEEEFIVAGMIFTEAGVRVERIGVA